MHRIGRTGRAEHEGKSILFYTEAETKDKEAIEELMKVEIPAVDFPIEVELSDELTPEERPKEIEIENPHKRKVEEVGTAFHEKSEKNSQTNQGGSYRREIAKKYKKPRTRGDKNYNNRNKKK